MTFLKATKTTNSCNECDIHQNTTSHNDTPSGDAFIDIEEQYNESEIEFEHTCHSQHLRLPGCSSGATTSELS